MDSGTGSTLASMVLAFDAYHTQKQRKQTGVSTGVMPCFLDPFD